MSDLRKDDGGPAFPVETDGAGNGKQTSPSHGWEKGMSLRDYFAAQALIGAMSGELIKGISLAAEQHGIDYAECLAKAAYEYADAMIKARSAQTPAEGIRE